MSDLTTLLEPGRLRPSKFDRPSILEQFYSDKSRIVFCSSFRRLMQKAQVFSLETNSSVRNRLTHTLEVADVGRTLGRAVGKLLHENGTIDFGEIETLQTIVENACLIHDLGNPPFGHFGESAVKKWFSSEGVTILKKLASDLFSLEMLNDFQNFDGNPQGFRIATKLHNEFDEFGLNLTAPTLLAAVKYPSVGSPNIKATFSKKIGIFRTEDKTYEDACKLIGHKSGTRYFLAYLMELADDICYCGSDIADSFEKNIISSQRFKEEYKSIATEIGADVYKPIPTEPIHHFGTQVSINLTRAIISQSAAYFSKNLSAFIEGKAPALAGVTDAGKTLEVLKLISRRHIYTSQEAQRIEIAGSTIMSGLLDHYSKLLKISQEDFFHFVDKDEMRDKSGLDLEWRIFNQLSPRMVKCYRHFISKKKPSPAEEWILRAHLIVDFVSGLMQKRDRMINDHLKRREALLFSQKCQQAF